MGESEGRGRFINPCFFHLQKLELELKCPACLNLLRRPVLLPCDHMFCSSCITTSTECGPVCPICKLCLLGQDMRVASHMEIIVSIYKSMSAAFNGNFCQPRLQVQFSEIKEPAIKHHDLGNRKVEGKLQENEAQNICRPKTSHTGMEAFAEQGPCSPLSSGGVKYSDDDSNDQGSVLSGKSSLPCDLYRKESELGVAKKLSFLPSPSKTELLISKTNLSGQRTDGTNTQSTFQIEQDHCRTLKRQKLNSELGDDVCKGGINVNVFGYQYVTKDVPIVSSESEYQGDTNITPANTSHKITSNPVFLCAFCRSSEESKASGPMLHYAHGEPIVPEQATRSNVLHVHQKCIEWAPQVFFVGDNAMNLEAEISRASKIKCSSCGQKGAALGCYAKSCRKSFHIPCAVEIADCRWDCDNFLVLCPAHSSRKLPSDRSNTGKSVRNLSPAAFKVSCSKPANKFSTVKQHADEVWMALPGVTKGWVLCGSALSATEKDMVAKFARLTGASVTKDWAQDVTHVIASTDSYGACSRTLKFLMAILSGKWILKIDWIKACLETKHPVAEENYEISHDIHGCFDGPRNGRIRVIDQAPKLFNGLSFYFSGDFVPTFKGYLEDLISAAGGNIMLEDAEESHLRSLVVYSLDLPLEGSSADRDVIDKGLQEAKAIATKVGAQVIGHTWVLDSIAACKVQPLLS